MNFYATLQKFFKVASDQHLSPKEILVILALIAFAPDCRPSWYSLIRYTGIPRATLARVLKRLKGQGLEIESGKEDRVRSTYYIVEYLKKIGFELFVPKNYQNKRDPSLPNGVTRENAARYYELVKQYELDGRSNASLDAQLFLENEMFKNYLEELRQKGEW
jgi:DNA-binding MarR family transcriptional regulator